MCVSFSSNVFVKQDTEVYKEKENEKKNLRKGGREKAIVPTVMGNNSKLVKKEKDE